MNYASKAIGCVVGFVAALSALVSGCTGDLLANFAEERAGNISVIVINNTPYRASFTLGAWDAFARAPFGAIELEQRRIEANQSSTPISIPCRRNTAIGTDNMVQRVIDTTADEEPGFDPDGFGAEINFSSAPIDSTAAALATEGTAEGVEVLLGADYKCGDQLIFTLSEDATATGGFRVTYQLLAAEPEDN